MAKRVRKVTVVKTKNGVRRIVQHRVTPEAQAKQANNQSMVTIEDSTIKMILADPRYLDAIPCLKSGKQALTSVSKKCGRCDRRRRQLRADAINQIKGCIAGLRGTQATTLKQLLGTQKVRVYQSAGRNRKPVPITI